MIASVEASLGRLGTDRIDVYWAQYPDHVTPAEEIIHGFEDLRGSVACWQDTLC
jgi:aryl-alcohol dehydrogenase-like predicted oxidoreductase